MRKSLPSEARVTQQLLRAYFNALDNKLFTILEIASRSTRATTPGSMDRSMLIPPTSAAGPKRAHRSSTNSETSHVCIDGV